MDYQKEQQTAVMISFPVGIYLFKVTNKKHCNEVWNMFKVNNKDTRRMQLESLFLLLTLSWCWYIELTTEDPMTTRPLTPEKTLKTQKRVLFIEQNILLLKIEFFECSRVFVVIGTSFESDWKRLGHVGTPWPHIIFLHWLGS